MNARKFCIDGAWFDPTSERPFGGYKQSGNGREYVHCVVMEFPQVKGIVGYGEA